MMLVKSIFCIVVSLKIVVGVGPLISDGWTPVIGSKAVKLPSGYVEHNQRPVQLQATDRIDEIDPLIQTLEEELIREEQEVEEGKKEEDQPLIVYPEGTFSSHPKEQQQQEPRIPPPHRRRPPPLLSRQAPPGPPLRPEPQRRLPQPPPPRRPPPRHRPPSLVSSFSNIGNNIKCLSEEVAADYRLSDKAYMETQIKCVLNEGPCDSVGITIKRMAPDIMRGLCPRPCNPCKKKQIQKIMATLAKSYPYEWAKMIKVFG